MKRKALLVINDEEDDFRRGYNTKKSDAKNDGFWDSTIDDGPVVVEDVIPVTRVTKGSWNEVLMDDSISNMITINARVSDGDSPPRRLVSSNKRDDDSPPRRLVSSNKRDDDSPPRRPVSSNKSYDTTNTHDRENDITVKNETTTRTEEGPIYNLAQPKVQPPTSHVAGLQSSSDFARREKELQDIKKNELKAIDPSLSGQYADTVYRDKRGRKLDMLNEFMRQEAIREGKEVKLKEATLEWGKATVQKQEHIEKIKEYEEVINEPFARSLDNPRLEKMRKEMRRDGDPMAAYLHSNDVDEPIEQQAQTQRSSGKPMYKGPTPRPNRFGIAPGYRWDGIERGKLFYLLNDLIYSLNHAFT